MNPNKPTPKPKSANAKLVGGSLIIILAWLLSGLIIYCIGDTWQERGTIGDMFGAINALFSGFAFVGILFALYLQRDEMKLQKQEIELNRSEIKKNTLIQENTQKVMSEQVIQMQITSKLNAMNTIMNYYNLQISNTHNTEEVIQKFKAKRKELIKKIDDLIDGLDNTDVE